MDHLAGGNGISLFERPDPKYQKELGEPMFTPDGESIYFTHATTPGNIFQYAENSNAELFATDRYDIKTGERTTAAGSTGGAVRPTPPPEGRGRGVGKRDRARARRHIQGLKQG